MCKSGLQHLKNNGHKHTRQAELLGDQQRDCQPFKNSVMGCLKVSYPNTHQVLLRRTFPKAWPYFTV